MPTAYKLRAGRAARSGNAEDDGSPNDSARQSQTNQPTRRHVFASRSFILATMLLFSSCANASARSKGRGEQTREQTIERARAAIAKRGWPLRSGYRVTFEKSFANLELGDSFEIDVITFTARGSRGEVISLYQVDIDRRTGNIYDIIDKRKDVRDEEVDVARRAFEKRFHLHENQYATTAGVRGTEVQITFSFDKFPKVSRTPGKLIPKRQARYFVDRHSLKVTRFEIDP